MNPLVVTAYYDIGRGGWGEMSRSRDVYVDSFGQYTARMSDQLYVLCDRETAALIPHPPKYLDVADLQELIAHRDYYARTAEVMSRQSFRSLFSTAEDDHHVEHKYPLYNIVTLAKWDALERAHRLTGGSYTHYVWADFALGKRALPEPSLPAFERFAPIERDRIAVSASTGSVPDLACKTLTGWVRSFRDRSSGNFMVVPEQLVDDFVAAARRNYDRLLNCGLACDDQLVIDMCIAEAASMFYLSYQRREGRGRFAHAHDMVRGKDTPTLKSHLARFALRARVSMRKRIKPVS